MQDKTKTYTTDKVAIARNFSRAAKHYDQAAFVQQEIGRRLLERCQWLKVQPQCILNLGSASGQLSEALQNLYPKAEIIGLDHAFGMCQVAVKKLPKKNYKTFLKKYPSFICADMEILPFRAQSFDLIISNCTFEWSRALPGLFLELKRVLKDKGNLLFTTVGPDTLFELAHTTHSVDGQYHVNAFLDMHDIGDILLKAGWCDPVMDKELMTVTYLTVRALLSDIKKSGSGYLFQRSHTSFQGKRWLAELIEQYDQFKLNDNVYPASVEIIYGYACKNTKDSIPTQIRVV